jgi:hypothetical protein
MDRDLAVWIKGDGVGGPAAAIARRRPLPWRQLTGDGRSRPSGPHFERDLALEEARGTRNTPGRLARACSGCDGALGGGGGLVRRRALVSSGPIVAEG